MEYSCTEWSMVASVDVHHHDHVGRRGTAKRYIVYTLDV